MKYPMSSTIQPGTPDGYMIRTDKAKGKNHLLKNANDAPVPSYAKTLLIPAGNATFCAMTYSKQLRIDFLSDI